MMNKKIMIAGVCLLAAIVLGLAAYLLVDRLAGGGTEAAAVTTTHAASDDDASGSLLTTSSLVPSSSEAADDGTADTEAANTYTGDTVSVTVTKVSTGTGVDAITYYVADVSLAPGTLLQAGLADNGQGTADTSDLADANSAIFAVNGDYFGARDDGIIIRNGEIYRDEPVRTGLALYKDGSMEIFDETQTSAQELLDQGVWNTYSFGPALLIDGEMPDNIGTYEVEQNPQHPIQGRNPRTGIGLIDNNHFVFVVVDGRSAGYSKGVTTEEFAQIFKDLGCTIAYNLDGGGSSTMYFKGEVINSPVNKGGQRDISDILFVE
jgi:exopolysaccharide biosynthesis protein